MIQRSAYDKIQRWKDSPKRNALLVTGARQVGKTFLIREFCRSNYEHTCEINLYNNVEARKAFNLAESKDELFRAISLFSNAKLIPGKTVIFLDEIQMAKEVYTKIKFLVEPRDFDYILSGSLLGVELNDVESVPVGYLDTVTMFPLNLQEYYSVRGVKEEHFDILLDCYKNKGEVPEYLHNRLMELTYEYLIVGGMPAVVDSFVEENNLQKVKEIQSNIIKLYKKDISQYNEDRSIYLKDIFDMIPAELNNQNKRFFISDIKESARYDNYSNDFLWLVDSNVALPVYNVTEPQTPLILNLQRNIFKLFLSDVGLLSSMLSKNVIANILAKNDKVNYGSLYENLFAEELSSKEHSLYFYNSKKHGEIDFVIESDNGIASIFEIKSGKDYKRHRALSNILKVDNYEFDDVVVFSSNNVSVKDGVSYLPIYFAMFV
jgi:predicted AAA+ superfamily ATPase